MADLERLVELRGTGERNPLFCVHAVSGSAYAYAGLVQALPPDQPVWGFEAPGFDNERPVVSSLSELSAEYVEILREFQPSGGYQLLGWSLGGVLAFDMAVRLLAAGQSVERLILVDAGLPWIAPLPTEKGILRRFLGDLVGVADLAAGGLDPVFADAAEDVEPATLFAAVERARIFPEEIDADLLEERYTPFRAHLQGLWSYEVTSPYAGTLVHLRAAASEPEFSRWDTVSREVVEHVLPGNHYSIWNGDSLAQLSTHVRQHLVDQ